MMNSKILFHYHTYMYTGGVVSLIQDTGRGAPASWGNRLYSVIEMQVNTTIGLEINKKRLLLTKMLPISIRFFIFNV